MHPSTTYHIYNHANGSDNLFREAANYSYFLSKWQKYITPIARTYAYCLMPNHFHFLIRIRDEALLAALMKKKINNKRPNLEGLPSIADPTEDQRYPHPPPDKSSSSSNLRGLNYYSNEAVSKYLSQQFSNLFNGYTKAINKRFKRYGSLFAPRFKRKEINNTSYFYHLLVYIHRNPIHHGFTSTLDGWPYSSWQEYDARKTWIDTTWLEKSFETRDQFCSMHTLSYKSMFQKINQDLES